MSCFSSIRPMASTADRRTSHVSPSPIKINSRSSGTIPLATAPAGDRINRPAASPDLLLRKLLLQVRIGLHPPDPREAVSAKERRTSQQGSPRAPLRPQCRRCYPPPWGRSGRGRRRQSGGPPTSCPPADARPRRSSSHKPRARSATVGGGATDLAGLGRELTSSSANSSTAAAAPWPDPRTARRRRSGGHPGGRHAASFSKLGAWERAGGAAAGPRLGTGLGEGVSGGAADLPRLSFCRRLTRAIITDLVMGPILARASAAERRTFHESSPRACCRSSAASRASGRIAPEL